MHLVKTFVDKMEANGVPCAKLVTLIFVRNLGQQLGSSHPEALRADAQRLAEGAEAEATEGGRARCGRTGVSLGAAGGPQDDSSEEEESSEDSSDEEEGAAPTITAAQAEEQQKAEYNDDPPPSDSAGLRAVRLGCIDASCRRPISHDLDSLVLPW
eukprot:6192365-Pleurochrysis_carterae.AAC.2